MNQKKSEDELLSKALGAWKLNDSLPPRFQERVWSRIEQAESIQAPSLWQQASAWLNHAFARPAVAVAYVSVLLVGGVLAGHVTADNAQAEFKSQLASKYVQAVDPYVNLEP